jgi:hypothetical protein
VTVYGSYRRDQGGPVDSNLERLQAAGIAVKTPLSEPHRSIVDEMSDQEVDALISLKGRFDKSSEVGAYVDEGERPADEFFAVL